MNDEKIFVRNALEETIRIGVFVWLASWCLFIVKPPFINPIFWGIIIAEAEYTGYPKSKCGLGGLGGDSA